MFQYITNLMRQGYHEESCRQRHLTLSPKDRPEKSNTALWDPPPSWSPPSSAPHRRVFVHSVFTVLFSTLIVCRHFQHFVSLMQICNVVVMKRPIRIPVKSTARLCSCNTKTTCSKSTGFTDWLCKNTQTGVAVLYTLLVCDKLVNFTLES